MRRFNRGFTLVELVASVALVGVIAAMALPNYGKYVYKAKMAEAAIIFSDFHRMAVLYQSQDEASPGSLNDICYQPPVSKFWTYAEQKTTPKPPPASNGSAKGKNSNSNGQNKTTICHGASGRGHTITVADPAVYNGHLNHGDTPGNCLAEAPQIFLAATSKGNVVGQCKSGSTMVMDIESPTFSVVDQSGNCSNYLPEALK